MASNPPPSQLRTIVGGTCDASGNLTLQSVVPSRSFYAAFTAILKASAGAPQWEIDLLGVPVGVGGGGTVVMGTIYSNPGDSFTVVVTGAAPGAVVSGGLYGFLSDTPEALPKLGVVSGGGGGAAGAGGALPGGQITVRKTLPASPAGTTTLIAIPCGGAAAIGVEISGALDASSVLSIQGTSDDVNWNALPVYSTAAPFTTAWVNGVSSVLVPSVGGGNYFVPSGGLSQVRVTWTPGAGQGNAPVLAMRAAPGAAFPVSIGQQAMAQSQPVVIASNQSAVPVSLAATQKPLAYQNRVAFAATAIQVASVAAEALLTLVPVRAGVAGAGVTSVAVTAGKVLQLTKLTISYRNNAAAAHFTRFVLRTNPSGATVVGSPALIASEVYATAALALVGQSLDVTLPEGLEFSGTDQIGLTHLCDAAAVGFSTASLVGFEYTP